MDGVVCNTNPTVRSKIVPILCGFAAQSHDYNDTIFFALPRDRLFAKRNSFKIAQASFRTISRLVAACEVRFSAPKWRGA